MNDESRVLTCVYCGKEYPQETPAWGDQVLTDHIKVCEKHPMRKLEKENALLKNALTGIVGYSTVPELIELRKTISAFSDPRDEDAIMSAIDALIYINQES
jgi:hypothetical protein